MDFGVDTFLQLNSHEELGAPLTGPASSSWPENENEATRMTGSQLLASVKSYKNASFAEISGITGTPTFNTISFACIQQSQANLSLSYTFFLPRFNILV